MNRKPRFGLFVFIVVLFCAAGCVTHVSDRNRPGEVDVTTPPERMDSPERLHPDEPGWLGLTTSLRPMLEIDEARGAADGRGGAPHFAMELSAGVRSMEELDSSPFSSAPVLGGVLGVIPSIADDEPGARLYLEADARVVGIARVSAGWSVRPSTGKHGPQVTLGMLHFTHVRWNWDGTRVVGFSVPFYASFLRSR